MGLRTDSAILLKCGFGKAPQLPRMQPLPFLCLQLFERIKANLEMLANLPAVELAGHPGELDVPVQRFIRDAQQRAVWHSKVEAIGRYCGAPTRMRSAFG